MKSFLSTYRTTYPKFSKIQDETINEFTVSEIVHIKNLLTEVQSSKGENKSDPGKSRIHFLPILFRSSKNVPRLGHYQQIQPCKMHIHKQAIA